MASFFPSVGGDLPDHDPYLLHLLLCMGFGL